MLSVQELLSWIQFLFGGVLYGAQIISCVDFRLAQRLGIQEQADQADPLLQRSERYTAYWDLFTLLWLPLGGVLMLIGHPYWPYVSLIGGAIYFDVSGREAAKILGFRHQGLKTGTRRQQKAFFASYLFMGGVGVLVLIHALTYLVRHP